jgi:nucleoside-diphosphate-sugar epimerase
MRVVVTGATGNIGTSTLKALGGDERVESILGIARRRPELELPKVEWAQADIRTADLTLQVPLMSSERARRELAWEPLRGADEALLELLEGLRAGRGLSTPPLDPSAGGPVRSGELATGVGAR